MDTVKFDNDAIGALYDKAVKIPMLWDLDALLGRTTENSIHRKKAIASLNLTGSSLNLTGSSIVLDVACGTGLNFKIIESYLRNNGRLVGVDLSPGVLKVAERQIVRRKWTNIELVNMSIADYEPGMLFDAALCTLAMTIIPDYEAAIDKIFNLLKPQGRFAMIGMRLSSRMPYKLGNPFMQWFCRFGGIDLQREVAAYMKAKCNKVDYEECFGGFYYILSTRKSCLI